MKFDFPKKIRSGYLVAFLLLLLCYFLSLSSFIQLRKQNKWVGHTRVVISELAALNAKLKDGEIGMLEFFLKQQREYFQDYTESKKLVDSMYRVLSKTVSESPQESKRVDSLYAIIKRKYSLMDDELLILGKNGNRVTDTLLAAEERNQKFIDSIDLVSSSITSLEDRLLAERTQRVLFYSKIVFGIIIIAGMISILLILYSLITFNMESRAKKNATIKAETYHEQLEKRVLELAAANRELVELRSLERFTSTGRMARVIAHEVRNPLTNIDLSAGHLENDSINAEDKKLFLEIINRNSKRINQLINELLSATKFSELKNEIVTANALLDEALNEAVDRAQLKHIQIKKNYSSQHIWVSVDRARMKIALLNIIVNGLEAMTGENCVLEVETALVDRNCIITIRDNGNGMDAETLAKVFDPYFTSKSNGNGLGMTNTQNIILNHKGKIESFSEVGQGTSFVISLNAIKK